jgi:processing peptidase subunit beta
MSVSFSTIIQKARPSPAAATSHAMREALAKIPPSAVTKLGNGVRVATEHNHHAKFATVGIWVDAGTRYDQRHSQGLSKVLQYAGFQGTLSADRQQLARTIDELGGQLTVETGRDQSYVALKVAKDNVPKAVAFLADVVRNARLTDADVEAAQKEVETARHQAEELVDGLVHDNLHVCAYDARSRAASATS